MLTENFWLLGKNEENRNVWLEKPSWDCGWYWGFGYLETMRGNRLPSLATDIQSHTHWDSQVSRSQHNAYDWFTETFGTPKDKKTKGKKCSRFTDDQIWQLCELMQSFYTLKNTAEILARGSAHYTDNPARKTILNKREAKRINTKVLPEIFKHIANIFNQVDNNPEGSSTKNNCSAT